MRPILLLCLTFFLLVPLISCAKSANSEDNKSEDAQGKKDKTEQTPEVAEYDLTKCGLGTNLSYENFAKTLISKHCLRCHDESYPRYDLSSLDQLHIWKNSILALSVHDSKMPPDYPLEASEKELLLEWISCGLP